MFAIVIKSSLSKTNLIEFTWSRFAHDLTIWEFSYHLEGYIIRFH